ncbi:uncharacterized protein LOC105164075 isoform X2 [Sesamum indicum]|uniref:Uncharacterized protein LOC105164075 isoform X2 n=1 Tax=Sesamum indicum TaxID=4182 RepID=A0A6I9T9E4_SESIN|nr:uncharacterized protein LOC105164075 isoform X2 [Sesamum indicum]
MRSGGINGTDSLETINAAAAAIESRVRRASVQKRRWGSCWSLYRCFGSYKHNKRIGRAVIVPETSASVMDVPTAEHPPRPPPLELPFVVPPSSPASFLPSDPPSSAQSPTGVLSLTSVSANMYSPGGPPSIFAIGPYAHETQLVSPPVFSTFATEPSTAPYTPPESVHLTTPSSPEVPFSRLLEPTLQNGEACQRYGFSQYEFQSYQLQPGSPVSHLISPSSGTSSPLPELEFATGIPFLLGFTTGHPPKLLDLDKIARGEWESREVSGEASPDATATEPRSSNCCHYNRQHSDVAPLPKIPNELQNDETAIDHRVSFEITTEEVVRSVEKKLPILHKAVPKPIEYVGHTAEERPIRTENLIGETSNNASETALPDCKNRQRHQKNQKITLGSGREFNFNSINGGNPDEPSIGPNWWVKETVLIDDGGPRKNWSFFPMMQTGVR